MDKLRKHFATDTEFEIALYILDTLNEQPQVFMVDDVLKQLYEKHGNEAAQFKLCNYVFNRMKEIEYIKTFNGAVKLGNEGVSYIAKKTFLQKGIETRHLTKFDKLYLFLSLALILIGAVVGIFCNDKDGRMISGILIVVGAFVLINGWLWTLIKDNLLENRT